MTDDQSKETDDYQSTEFGDRAGGYARAMWAQRHLIAFAPEAMARESERRTKATLESVVTPAYVALDEGQQEALHTFWMETFQALRDMNKEARAAGVSRLAERKAREQGVTLLREMDSKLDSYYKPLPAKLRRIAHDFARPVTEDAIVKLQHAQNLYRSALINVVSEFEYLLGQLFHVFYRRFPGMLDSKEKVLSTTELGMCGDIEEVWTYLIERRVDALLRESAVEWNQFFGRNAKVALDQLTPDWERFKEIFQRRHLFVHSKGRITRRYLANVDPELVAADLGEARVGQPIWLESEYVASAAGELEVTGLSLLLHLWRHLEPEQQRHIIDFFHDQLDEYLSQGEWVLASRLVANGLPLAPDDFPHAVLCVMKAGLASKRLGYWTDMWRETLEPLASANMDAVLEAGRLVLLDDQQRAIDVIASRSDEISGTDWYLSPFLQELEAEPRFRELRARIMEA